MVAFSNTRLLRRLLGQIFQFVDSKSWSMSTTRSNGLRRSARIQARHAQARAQLPPNYVSQETQYSPRLGTSQAPGPPPDPPSPSSSGLSSPPRSPGPTSPKSSSGSTKKQGAVVSGRIEKKWRSNIKTTTARGLYNKGNFCYRNSVLQCLIHLPEVVHYLDSIHPREKCLPTPTHKCVVCALKALVHAYWFVDAEEAPPKGPRNNVALLNTAIKMTVPEGHPMEEDIENEYQADAFDFLQYLLEALNQAELEGNEFKLADLFDIEHKRQWTCEECGNERVVNESVANSGLGFGLSVTIDAPQRGFTLLKYLRDNFYEELLPNRCESAKCMAKYGKKHDGFPRKKRRTITKAPEIVIIRLVPWNGHKKVLGNTVFSEYLNLGEFTEAKDPLLYKLQAVVAHRGESLEGGHYIAAVREQNERTFCSINDDKLIGQERRGNIEELEWPRSKQRNFDPYLLFYSKL